MQNQKIPEEPKTQTEWGRQAHLNVCSVWKEPHTRVLTCDLYFLRFVFDLTRRQSWLFGFKRWYERKSTHRLSGEKHVNDVCPLPGVLTQDFASYSSPKMPWWHCGEARSRLQWSCVAQWWGGECVCGGASENDAWPEITSPQRQQSITQATLPFPITPSLACAKVVRLTLQI